MNKRTFSALLAAIILSLSVYGAAVWVGSQYIETFQNGFLFGNFNILKVSNEVPEFEDASGNVKRLDDMSGKRIKLEDFESDVNAADFLCGTNLTASNETATPIRGVTSIDIDQGATAASASAVCDSQAVTLEDKHQGKFVGACFYSMWDGNDNEMKVVINDNTNTVELGSVDIRASTEPLEHCVYFNTATDTASIDYDIEVNTGNNNTTLRLDDFEFRVDPLAPTDIYASSEWESCGLTASDFTGFGTVSSIEDLCKRDGDDLIMSIKFTSGTSTATEAQINLKDSLVIDSSKVPSVQAVGTWFRGRSTTSSGGAVLATGGDSFLNFSHRAVFSSDSSPNALSPANGDDTVISTDEMSFIARIPIAGWSDTAQGVVVKNRTDSAGVENVFSAKIASDGTVSDENVDFINGNCSKGGTGIYNCALINGLFSNAPNYSFGGSPANRIVNMNSISTTAFRADVTSDGGSAADDGFSITLTRSGTDYIKETDKVYTVDVSQLRGNWVRAEGNGGTSLTANVTPIDFTEVTDTANAWDGDEYTVQENDSVISINGGFYFSATGGQSIRIYKNNALYKSIHYCDTCSDDVFSFKSSRGEFSKGDVLDLRTVNARTLLNASSFHYLNIVEEYGQQGVYLGTFAMPTCFVKDVKASGTSGGTSSTSYTQRDLNTISGSCSFISLTSNKITLDSGAYLIRAKVPGFDTTNFKAKLVRDPDGTPVDEIIGTSAYSNPSNAGVNYSFIDGEVSVNSSTTFNVQMIAVSAVTDGLGRPYSPFGDSEVYTTVEVTKIR